MPVGASPYHMGMEFRAVVQDGLIVVNTHGVLADGTPVRVVVARGRKAGAKAKRVKASPKARKSAGGDGHAPGFGMWADRTELGSSAEAVNRLRALTRRRRFE